MGVNTDHSKLVIITVIKSIYFDLSEMFDNSMKHEIDFLTK